MNNVKDDTIGMELSFFAFPLKWFPGLPWRNVVPSHGTCNLWISKHTPDLMWGSGNGDRLCNVSITQDKVLWFTVKINQIKMSFEKKWNTWIIIQKIIWYYLSFQLSKILPPGHLSGYNNCRKEMEKYRSSNFDRSGLCKLFAHRYSIFLDYLFFCCMVFLCWFCPKQDLEIYVSPDSIHILTFRQKLLPLRLWSNLLLLQY